MVGNRNKNKTADKACFQHNNKLRGKKAYYYSLDAFIAIIVITIGLFIVLQSGSNAQPKQNIYIFSESITNYFTHTKIYDLNDELYPTTIKVWKQDGTITYFTNNLLEQTGELYAKGQLPLANQFVENVTGNAIDPNFNFELIIDNIQIFNETKIPKENSKSLISSTVLITGLIDASTSWGPYVAEIRVWQ